jgi:hypothetical protein
MERVPTLQILKQWKYSEEGLTELRIRRSYGPILFADVRGTISKKTVEIKTKVAGQEFVTKPECARTITNE